MQRPVITNYKDPVDFMRDMISFRKHIGDGFTIQIATRDLRRVSPALVSLILKRKRSLTLDRADEFARLLGLNASEKFYFKNWIEQKDLPEQTRSAHEPVHNHQVGRRKDVSTSILNDWINVYVKDYFQIPAVQKNPGLLESLFQHAATPKRIEKAKQYLLREGHLRRTLDGRLVLETNLAVAEPPAPSKKIREFHKAALNLAKRAIDVFSPSERRANTLIIPLNEKSHLELMKIVDEFGERLRDFAANQEGNGDRLYQLLINISPIGGKVE